jgi:ankyrin repeat protein
MTKKEMKVFFKAIADNDLAKVTELLDADKAYLTICNFTPPKKDDGQSGLQLAFKTGNLEIAQLLIERGADINFMETSTVNEWTAPVLHDCIRATIFFSYTMRKDTTRFDKAFSLLQMMLDQKANPNAVDSYGNNGLVRAVLDARQMINHPNVDLENEILLTQLRKVFQALIVAGADKNAGNEKRPSAMDIINNYRMERYELC